MYDRKNNVLVDATKHHLDVIENLNPACPACNNYKHTLTLEKFRIELSKQVERAMNSCNFRLALKYKQIIINQSPIVFYFKKMQNECT